MADTQIESLVELFRKESEAWIKKMQKYLTFMNPEVITQMIKDRQYDDMRKKRISYSITNKDDSVEWEIKK